MNKKYTISDREVISGTLIVYNNSSSTRWGIIDNTDIEEELDMFEEIGNIFTDDELTIANNTIQWLILNGTISHEEIEDNKQAILDEIKIFKEQNEFKNV